MSSLGEVRVGVLQRSDHITQEDQKRKSLFLNTRVSQRDGLPGVTKAVFHHGTLSLRDGSHWIIAWLSHMRLNQIQDFGGMKRF